MYFCTAANIANTKSPTHIINNKQWCIIVDTLSPFEIVEGISISCSRVNIIAFSLIIYDDWIKLQCDVEKLLY